MTGRILADADVAWFAYMCAAALALAAISIAEGVTDTTGRRDDGKSWN